MTKAEIYQEIRNISPTWSGEAQELVENLEEFENDELLQDLDDVYQEWSRKENDDSVQQCVSLFDVILQAIFNHGDPSVIPHLLKYVPSDDYYEDAVVMEDYSSEPLCNGIVDANYFGEAYIPVLLSCIHELVPRAMSAAKWFFYWMRDDNFDHFSENQTLINNLYLAKKEPFIKILNYTIQETTEDLEKIKKDGKQETIEVLNKALNRSEIVRQAFLKLHADV
ncbi:hypothetical protein P618_200149 [Holospora obtusa F1]|uniref:Uncharacterized protein n=1 Tax=Holospora obtusa F1 TaxID=1399147 RepID=W6TI18_HOLOB|nr:hypothetical protein [Holospora obtusa]ETZ07645.1 hypothetical protein P618_200149 [Holospora obtusa F1]